MQEFDLRTFDSKVFPAIDPLVARSGERVRIGTRASRPARSAAIPTSAIR